MRIVLVYIILGVFFGTERRLRRGQVALRMDAAQPDRGSTRLIGAAFGIMLNVLLLAPLLNRLRVGQLKVRSFIPWLGILLMVFGLVLRAWANRTLGEFYTRTLIITSRQHIVEGGPYRVVRHPGYLGNLMMWAGAALATANWIALALAALTMLPAYLYRIRSEEAMLRQAFNREFAAYASRTWRLIPRVY